MTWDALKKDKPKIANSVDGYVRTEEDEAKLNKHFATLFKGDDGKVVLDYLQSITTEAVAGPNITSNQLFHIEGRVRIFHFLNKYLYHYHFDQLILAPIMRFDYLI